MSLLRRTFGCLKPYWKRIFVASFSASIHALLAGLLIWLAGPLLMTLLTSGIDPDVENKNNIIIQPETITSEADIDIQSEIEKKLDVELDFLVRTKNNIKQELNELVTGRDKTETLYNFCLLIVIIAFGSNLFLYLQGFFMAFVQQSVIRDFRNRLFEKYQKLSLSYFFHQRTGQLISRVTNDVVVLNETVDLGFNRLVSDSLSVLLLSTFLILLSWKLTLFAALVLPLVFGFIYFMGKKLRKYSARSQEKMADVNSVLEETVSNIRIVKAYAMEKFETGKFFGATGDFFKALVRMTRIRHLASPINEILITGAGITILFFAGTQIIEGQGALDAGDFMTFIIAMFSMVKPVKSLLAIHVKIQEGMAAAERIFEVLDAPITVKESDNPKEILNFESSIKFENVSFAYNKPEMILKDISFDVKKGEVIALVGPSGAGKSTMFDLLPRFYDPTEGRISIDGIDIKEFKMDSLRRMLGIVTQETYLFNETIKANIAYGLKNISMNEIEKAAKAANAFDFISKFDDGFETQVGNRGVRLSGGQRQRIAIARALLKNPQILIFDEATSALDTESELQVQEAIDRLMASRTTLVIAHRLSTIKHADRILVIDQGNLAECGTHEQLIEKGGLYKRLYMMQFKEKERV
ncbi:MAG: ABC transporter ATP-binding protein [candidate division Zixibacteria bacterium]|nr:ABC transporter ATP-binding protein [candidate division Zixibacteria bacterium]